MTAEIFSFGIIGTGVVSNWHAAGIEAHPDGRIVAVADVVAANAEKFSAAHGDCAIYHDYHEMLRRDDIQAVCICTPSGLHAEQAIAAAEAGKHVLVEKPMALNVRDCRRMIEAAQANKVALAVVYQLRTNQSARRLRQGVLDGAFGKPVFADASIKYWRNQAYYDSSVWRGTWKMDGGGCSMNQGSHGIDLLLYIAGDVDRIYAKLGTAAHTIEVEDWAVALLTYKSGAHGRLQTTTAVNPGAGNIIEIGGTLGSATMVDDNITSWALSESSDVLARETIQKTEHQVFGGASSSTGFPVEGHIMSVANFISHVRAGEELICPAAEGLKSVQLIMALYESARRGEEVALDELLECART